MERRTFFGFLASLVGVAAGAKVVDYPVGEAMKPLVGVKQPSQHLVEVEWISVTAAASMDDEHARQLEAVLNREPVRSHLIEGVRKAEIEFVDNQLRILHWGPNS